MDKKSPIYSQIVKQFDETINGEAKIKNIKIV
jgi:DNA-binding transcriptional regulator YhcF (GntR family)